MRLTDWQSAFIDALESKENANRLNQFINERELKRVDIYRNNTFQALVGALQLVFPVCKEVVGDICFTQLVKGYCQQYPLKDSNLNRYGRDFPRWLADEVSLHSAFVDLPYLPELAELEWQINQSYYAMDLPTFLQAPHYHLDALAELSEKVQQQAILLLRPDLALLSCQYPVQQVWIRHKELQGIETPAGEPCHYLLVHRDRFKVSLSATTQAEMQLLQAVQAGQNLAQITHFEHDISLLPKLIGRQWICGFYLPTPQKSER